MALCCFLFGRLLFLRRDSIGELVAALTDSPGECDNTASDTDHTLQRLNYVIILYLA